MRVRGFLIVCAALSFGSPFMVKEVASAARHDDIFELFLDNADISGEVRKKRPARAERQRRSSFFGLFDDDRNTKARSTRQRQQPRSQAITAQPEKPPKKKLQAMKAGTRLATAPVPQAKPTVSASSAPTVPSAPAVVRNTPKVSCEQAKDIIAKYAFTDIVQDSCRGEVYQFAAMRGGKGFLIKISGKNGELLEVKKDSGATAANQHPSRPQASYHLIPKSELPPP